MMKKSPSSRRVTPSIRVPSAKAAHPKENDKYLVAKPSERKSECDERDAMKKRIDEFLNKLSCEDGPISEAARKTMSKSSIPPFRPSATTNHATSMVITPAELQEQLSDRKQGYLKGTHCTQLKQVAKPIGAHRVETCEENGNTLKAGKSTQRVTRFNPPKEVHSVRHTAKSIDRAQTTKPLNAKPANEQVHPPKASTPAPHHQHGHSVAIAVPHHANLAASEVPAVKESIGGAAAPRKSVTTTVVEKKPATIFLTDDEKKLYGDRCLDNFEKDGILGR